MLSAMTTLYLKSKKKNLKDKYIDDAFILVVSCHGLFPCG